jgi:hypothetical protein
MRPNCPLASVVAHLTFKRRDPCSAAQRSVEGAQVADQHESVKPHRPTAREGRRGKGTGHDLHADTTDREAIGLYGSSGWTGSASSGV